MLIITNSTVVKFYCKFLTWTVNEKKQKFKLVHIAC